MKAQRLLVSWLAFVGLAHADIIVGTNNGGANLFPFGSTNYIGEYQQLYASTAFPGAVTITGLEFASSSVTGPNLSETFTATIGLSTTSATVASMSTTYAANKGGDFTQVFSGTVGFTSKGTNTFDLIFATSPFLYNPGLGNLLLDVVISSSPTNTISFDFTHGAVTSRVGNSSGNGAPFFDQGNGLVTDFVTTSAAVPEPASVLLLLTVTVLLGTALRRRAVV